MQKTKQYERTRLVPDAIQELENHVVANSLVKESDMHTFSVTLRDRETWEFETFQEFLAEYPGALEASYTRWGDKFFLKVHLFGIPQRTYLEVKAASRESIQRIFNIVERYRERSTIPPDPEEEEHPVIFIGHGRSRQWRELKDHLHEKHKYQVEAFEVGERAGHHIRDILEEMLTRSSIAFLVFTGEDETADGKMLVRQNVVHEAGLFQGRLGFPRAIIVREDGAEDFSNIAGIQQIRFSRDNIKEAFGDVLSVLKREFGT